MSDIKAVMAGMEMLGWDIVDEDWTGSLDRRREFLERRYAGAAPEGFDQVEKQKHLNEVNRLSHSKPERVLFTTTGIVFGDKARRWRSAWWHISHITIERAGWELLRIKWLHRWGIFGRELGIPMPSGAAKHVAEMVDVILERNPHQSSVELIDEEEHLRPPLT